jgi:hypothetical protein
LLSYPTPIQRFALIYFTGLWQFGDQEGGNVSIKRAQGTPEKEKDPTPIQ